MKSFKLLTIMAASLVASTMTSVAFASAATFSDTGNSYALSEIQTLSNAGILSGYKDGTFRPNHPMTREEFAVVLAKSLKLTPDASASSQFTDVDGWARPYVGALVNDKLTSGISATQFGAQHLISREQLAVFFIRALGEENFARQMSLSPTFSDAKTIDEYAVPYVAIAQKIGLLKGSANSDGSFQLNPAQSADRQAVARLAYEVYANAGSYQSRVDTMAKTLDILNKSNAAMEAEHSFQMNVALHATGNGSPGQIHTQLALEIDYTKQPAIIHAKGNVSISADGNSGANAQGTIPLEVYEVNGTVHILNPFTNTWDKQSADGSLIPLPNFTQHQSEINMLAADLRATKTGDSYVLTGTLDDHEMNALMGGNDAIPQNVPGLHATPSTTNVTIVIDKHTNLLNSMTLELPPEANGSFAITWSNYNNVAPIQVPQDVLHS
ncbi:S-layer homology domain-containing protein [Fodinisporobacter ferrooxydans]|uniref:S-layer homology domain-containing protein n=1 Tax=Fodinisporobacter ferrooxydans TaxID=2901836 RepID=A0ABY4CJW6_9BACL|nr:S-layer homology domain-containing protein [Alicyclobacillaceae bacterium MYW30-H2]